MLRTHPVCGAAVDTDALGRTPFLTCPKCNKPLDQASLDEMFPEPRANDPQRDAKLAVREQEQADLDAFLVTE